jgi:lycopene cyclase domain-containing protein
VKLRCNLKLFESAKQGVLVLGSLFVIGTALDTFALTRGYWHYDEKFFVGIKIGVMPLEEYLFMIVIPFLTLTIYRMARRKHSPD